MDVVERTPCEGAALYDPTVRSWSVLPAGTFDYVRAAAVDGGGLLVVAGSLGSGASLQHRVARFDGSTWTVLGGNFDGPVLALATFGNDVMVGGSFSNNAGLPLANVARWSGSSWSGMGGGVAGPAAAVTAVCMPGNGPPLIGGTFTTAGGVAAANIAQWNGSAWQALGSGLPAEITSIVTFATGEVFATGLNQTEPSMWGGSNWTQLTGLLPPGSGYPTSWVSALQVEQSSFGEALVAAGNFELSSSGVGVGRWEPGIGWTYAPASLGGIASEPPTRMAFSFTPLPVGGGTATFALAGPFTHVGGFACRGVVRVEQGWPDPLGAGVDNVVLASTQLQNGDLLLGGRFRQIGRLYVAGLARSGNGVAWSAPTIGGIPAIGWGGAIEVRDFATTSSGDVLIGGKFGVGNALGGDIARFDGTSWTAFGPSPFAYGANAVLQAANGDVYCGGTGVYRRDGTTWTLLSSVASGLGATCYTLAELANGDIVVGGDLQVIPGGSRPGVMRWNGSSWLPIGAGLASVAPAGNLIVVASRVRDDGVLFVVGKAGTTSFAASFDGSAWQLLPGAVNGQLFAVELLPDGDVVVGGEFDAIAGVNAASVARFDGSAWHAIGDGVRRVDGQPGTVLGLHFATDGDLHISGEFARHDGQVSVNFTRVRSLCPATVQSFGVGCIGSGNQIELRRVSGPWLGASMRGVATGLANSSLAIDVLGLTPAFASLPTSGCTLWVSPDLLTVVAPVSGAAHTQLAIPETAALTGQVLFQQVVEVAFVGGSIASFASSNRLQHTIGVF